MITLILVGVNLCNAQTIVNMPDVNKRPTMGAVSLGAEPMMDGQVIGDPIWEAIKPTDQMIQTKPNAGFSASEKTDVRIGYTATTLYVSVVCYDSEPAKLVVSDARRDATLDNTDSFLFILDTFHDGQNGFIFWNKPNWH
ncbi:MAG: hypothetical protein IPK96_06145 [Flammeovirgaceae bacterium]|nr:hypothetical protein [Flammeovirgaceae bacterium]